MNRKLALLLTPAVAITLSMFQADGSSSVAAVNAPKLFSIVSAARAVPPQEASSVASVREAEILFPVTVAELADTTELVIPFFDGVERIAARYDLEKRSTGDITWRGKIANIDDVIVTSRNGFVSALIYGPDSVYEIVPRGAKHILVELDQSRFPECGGAVENKNTLVGSHAANVAAVDSGDRIDVVIVYTTATKNFLGGDAQARALAQASVDAANTAYLNSRIRQRLRLVHSEEYVYTESGNGSSDLTTLRDDPRIQGLRDTHKADLVAEISEVTGICGIGYLLSGPGGNPIGGFSVTARSCAVGNLTFPHELGHNMGSHHNPENGGTALFPYAYGHYVNGSYRTVMSYVDPCVNGCIRRPYFSNPLIVFNNVPTGTNLRDNARMLNTTADWVAGYRYSGSSLTLLNSTSAADWLPRGVSRNITWQSDELPGSVRIDLSRDEGTNWETLVASTPNDGSEPIVVSGRATRRARFRVVSLSSPTVSDSSVSNISIR